VVKIKKGERFHPLSFFLPLGTEFKLSRFRDLFLSQYIIKIAVLVFWSEYFYYFPEYTIVLK